MADGFGNKVGSAYALKYRRDFTCGSPTLFTVDGDGDPANFLLWSHFFFGNHSNTSQAQSSDCAGSVSGIAGVGSTAQAQTQASAGTLSEFVRLDTSIDLALRIKSAYGFKYRDSFTSGINVKPVWTNKEYAFVWNNFFFGIGSASSQGSSSSTAEGSITGEGWIAGGSGSEQGQTQNSTALIQNGFGSRIIVTGGDVVSDITTRVYDSETGDLLWSANHTASVRAVAVDDDGNVYTAGSRAADNYTTRKYNYEGVLQWSADHGGLCYGIAVDNDGNVITVGTVVSGVTTRKYNSSGTEITTGWPVNHGGTVYGVAVDSSDNVYTVGENSSSRNLRKYNSNGTLEWSGQHGTDTLSVSADGTIAICGDQNSVDSDRTTRINRTGETTAGWTYSYAHGAIMRGIAQARDSSGSLINSFVVVGSWVSSISTRVIVASTGAATWTADHGTRVNACCVDRNDGSVYTAGDLTSSVTTRKYSQSGTEITSGNWPLNHGGRVYGIAWSPFRPANVLPGLPVPIALGIPIATQSSGPPGLALRVALGVPTSTPRPEPGFQPNAAQVFRLFLTGDSSLLELPMSGLQCRRRLGESTWLTVEIPTYSAALAAAIAAVATRELVIYAGYVAGGVETSGEMMRATLTEIRDERDSGRGFIQLTGRVIPTTATVTSHTLPAVRQRGKDDRGRRTVTCGVDPRIRPNHTVNDGLNTFTVGGILYRISPAESTMWVVEGS